MAGLTWFELDVDFHEDPKIKALVSRLRQPLADSYVSRLYAYCYKHAVDRFPPESAADTIEDIARWKGRRGVLFDALFAVEVLERDSGKIVVHGVAARLGPHLAKKQADAERQRKHRDKVAAAIVHNAPVTRDVTRDVTPDVTRESRRNRDKDKDQLQEAGSLAPRLVSPLVAFLRETYPDIRDPWKVEAAWAKAYPRIDLLAEAIKARAWEVANPAKAKKHHASFLNRWYANATGRLPPLVSRTHGDLGSEIHPWPMRLTEEEAQAYFNERTMIDPDLDGAPVGVPGPNNCPKIAALNERYRAVAEARA